MSLRPGAVLRLPALGLVYRWRLVLAPLVPGGVAGYGCKYEPSCSRYAVQAIEEFGILRGLVLASWRLLRCNPLSDGGFDPVSEQRLFHSAGSHRHA